MKKLLVLTLVLGIASLATAGIEWAQTDNGNGTFTIMLTPTGASASSYVFINALDVEVATTSGLPVGLSMLGDDGLQNGGKTYGIEYAGDLETPSVAAGEALLQFTVTASAGDTINILGPSTDGHPSLAASSYKLDGATLAFTGGMETITIVPEPATLALLGLGALVLRRKK